MSISPITHQLALAVAAWQPNDRRKSTPRPAPQPLNTPVAGAYRLDARAHAAPRRRIDLYA